MSRKAYMYSAALASLLLSAALTGCGSDNKEGGISPADVPKVSEAACAQCHGSAVSSVTGNLIYSGGFGGGYNASSHLQNGCQSCHGGGAQHNGVGPLPFPKPDVDGQCVKCHDAAFFAAKTGPSQAHLTAVAVGTLKSATYQTSKSKCTDCHDPHSTAAVKAGAIYGEWAESGHADVQSMPWIDYDFGATSRAACSRCHTATGYGMYLADPNATGWAWKTDQDPVEHEILRCTTCHTNYSFARKNGATNGAGGAKLPYLSSNNVTVGGVKSSIPLANAGDSNLCINCHTGRQSGSDIPNILANALSGTTPISGFTNISSGTGFSSFNSHYLPAAGVLNGINGYEYSAHSKYVAAGFRHNQIGGTDSGPCVGCHLPAANHSLEAVTISTGSKLTGVVSGFPAAAPCASCHTGSFALAAADLNTLKGQYKAGLDAITNLFSARYGIKFDDAAYPYFSASGKSSIYWQRLAKAGGDTNTDGKAAERLIGAAFNLKMLTSDFGGYAHNQQYTMALIYDTIDYLENGKVTGTLTGTGSVPLATLQAIFGAPTPTTVGPRPI